MQCEVWSVECEDFASSLAEKIKRLSREGHGRDRVSLNYRSFMFGKLPPPACPGLCYSYVTHTYVIASCIHVYHMCEFQSIAMMFNDKRWDPPCSPQPTVFLQWVLPSCAVQFSN